MSSPSLPVERAASESRVRPGFALIVRALWQIGAHEVFLRRHPSFAELLEQLRSIPVAPCEPAPDVVDRVKAAIDEACIWYPRRPVWLQRSALAFQGLGSTGWRSSF